MSDEAGGSVFNTIKIWLQLSRLPFHLVGVLPFILGMVLAWRITGSFNLSVFIISIIAVVLIMLSTYYAGEYYDLHVDRLSAGMEKNAFSGGTQVIVRNLIPHNHARIASYVTIALACIIGVILQFYYKTGLWTIPLGVSGTISGFYYSTPPMRWVKRGIGESLIGYCYGWLPVAASFYLQSGGIAEIVHWVSVPIACTIFNVILINEFPDYPADIIEGKRNLVVRLGKGVSAFIYIAMTAIALLSFGFSMTKGLPSITLLFCFPFLLIALALIYLMAKKDYLNRNRLELICGLTIVVNFGISLAYILGVCLRGVSS